MKDDNYDSILLDYEGPDPEKLAEREEEEAKKVKRVPVGGTGVKTIAQIMAEQKAAKEVKFDDTNKTIQNNIAVALNTKMKSAQSKVNYQLASKAEKSAKNIEL